MVDGLALDLSRRMHDAARQGDWTTVASLRAEREPRLEAHDDGISIETLRQMRRLDEKTVQWAEEARDAVGREIADLQRDDRATNLYNEQANRAARSE